MRRFLLTVAVTVVLAVAPGCADRGPVVVSRETLGTVVSVTAYGPDRDAVLQAIEDAYAAMAAVEAAADAYDPASDIARFNASPYEKQALPEPAVATLDALKALGNPDGFSISMLGVSRLYAFEESGAVPPAADRERAVEAARGFAPSGTGEGAFARLGDPDERLDPGGTLAPGLDLGGAAKGLALDRARDVLRASGAITAAIISAGSSTVTLGTKPDGSAWRVGIEDPRDPERVVAVFALEGEGALSTSGDYQRSFKVDGVRYHHILDPETGLPARGVRSLSIAGTSLSGLDTDILSTALFVQGPEAAAAYARQRGAALYVVDDEGRALVVPAPEDSGLTVAEEAPPTR